MKKIIAAIFVISVLVSCSASKDSSTAIEEPTVPARSVSPNNPNNYPVK